MAILKTSTSLLLAAALLFQAACSEESAEPRRPKLHHTSWKEEVKLQDGRVILIQRNIESRMIHTDTFRPAYKPVKQEVIVLDAAGLDTPPPYSDKWKPMLLDKDTDGVWFMVVTPTSCYDWGDYYFAYRKYRAVDGKWQQVVYEQLDSMKQPLTEKHFDLKLMGRDANISWLYKYNGMPETLYLQDKPFDKENDRSEIDSKKIIHREPVLCPSKKAVEAGKKFQSSIKE